MKPLFIFCILISQHQVFSSECDLIFDNKNPEHIIKQIEEILLMDIEKGLLCFNALKSFLIEAWDPKNSLNKNVQDTIVHTVYGNHHHSNLERIQYLMSLLLSHTKIEDVKPRMHSEITSRNKFPIFGTRVTLSQMNKTPIITTHPEQLENISSKMDIQKIQSQGQTPILWNPYPFLNIKKSPQTPSQDQSEKTDTVNLDPTTDEQAEPFVEEDSIWTETFHIEFPAIVLCRKTSDDTATLFLKTSKQYEYELTKFVEQNIDIEEIYIHVIEWMDSIRNQNGYNLQNTHSLFNFTSYSVQLSQIPDFIIDSMTIEQKEKFMTMMELIKKYMWMYNLYFEYRQCLPTAFREHLFLSYSTATPFQIKSDFNKSSEHHLNISVFYEFSAYTPSFVSPFKQSQPLHVFQQNTVNWNDFESNELRKKYEGRWGEKCKKNKEECNKIHESKWNTTLEFLKTFISKNRTYLNVSF